MAPPGDPSCDGSANQQISHRCGTGSPVIYHEEEVTRVTDGIEGGARFDITDVEFVE